MTTKPEQEMGLDDLIKKEKQQKRLNKGKKGFSASTTLLISNLNLEVNDSELYKIFSEKGSLIKCKVSEDQFKRSLGKAVVRFEKLSEAQVALETLNDFEIKGQKIKIKY